MPIFDYVCEECNTRKEVLVLRDTGAVVNCRRCKAAMTKAVSAPGLLVTNFHDKPSVKARISE